MPRTALILANGLFRTVNGKTAHGLVRGSRRFRIVGVIDPTCEGQDAGEVLDGLHRAIPIFASVESALDLLEFCPDDCIVGVASHGGSLPPELRDDLLLAACRGLSLVNGLHEFLSDDAELVELAGISGAQITDIRKPPPRGTLRFWKGEVLDLSMPIVAVLGTDCAIGKRTTCWELTESCRKRGIAAEMIYTGQTGWMQGVPHGFILDAVPNDFVCGELEKAIVEAARRESPEVIFLEGQGALRSPFGPCGAELILAGSARAVILQHAPHRRYFNGFEELQLEIPTIEEEIELIRLIGAEVWAVTLFESGPVEGGSVDPAPDLASKLEIPVVSPMREGFDGLASIVENKMKGAGG